MIVLINGKSYNLSWSVNFKEKISELKKSNDTTIAFDLPNNTENLEDIINGISNINIEVVKGTQTSILYKWVFYNCNLIQCHSVPNKYHSDYKTIYIKFSYDDVFGSNKDSIITTKMRDKKLNDLLK